MAFYGNVGGFLAVIHPPCGLPVFHVLAKQVPWLLKRSFKSHQHNDSLGAPNESLPKALLYWVRLPFEKAKINGDDAKHTSSEVLVLRSAVIPQLGGVSGIHVAHSGIIIFWAGVMHDLV
jgi:hypothetical protein